MSRRAAALLLAASAGVAGDPVLAIATTGFTYDLRQGGAILPLCWGPVTLHYPGTARVRIDVFFLQDASHAAGTADDILSLRSGLKVDVVDARKAIVDGKEWTWSGPIRGDVNGFSLASSEAVSADNALLALRQVCYANLAPPQALAKRQVEFSLTFDRTSIQAKVEITPNVTPMPPVARFEPLLLHRLQSGVSRIRAHACSPAAAFFLARADAAFDVIDAGGAGKPTLLPRLPGQSGTEVEVTAPAVDGRWQLAVIVSDGTCTSLAAVPVLVRDDTATLAIAGALPLELSLAADLPDAVDLGLAIQVSTGTLAVDVVPHPALPGTALHDEAVRGAFDFAALPQLRLRRSVVRQQVTTPCWIAVGLDLHVGEEVHRLVPWIVHLVHGNDG